ncbi:ABC-type cobalt transport system, ATPase component [Marinitoga piezophila KA3]|uniref:ABC-type cobalt transport system, ATPase component n=1 Tax=Marinitoga piezophila (strain DSM 14283 / JCM 11233 / KA3) TaxID=443254 RepID=H2J5K4_MARPK|nr:MULTISPECIES: ATP-binding cassette domain-containing protein [Marinitoga]AEX86148.1 ABC-type cobalt transport system, ATPase component [Marinitoga piezophila KA3]APT76563.1 ABC transporter [Marinitoga sp. 1137]NUU98249.1 ABC transporter [Marinitoga sp. 1138]
MSIEIRDLNYTYAEGTPFESIALKNINWKINEGEMWLLLGKTGSGKTTLIQNINGLLIPKNGEVIVDGLKTSDKNVNIKDIRKNVGIVFQYPENQFFLPTVLEEILYAPKNFGIEISKNELLEILKIVGLTPEFLTRNPFSLSGGEMRRVAIASVLAYNPKYIVFDEPTVGLDYNGRKKIWQIIENLRKAGKTIIIVTHWIDDLISFKPKVLHIQNREISFKGEFNDFIMLGEEELKKRSISLSEKLKLYYCSLKNNITLEKLFQY